MAVLIPSSDFRKTLVSFSVAAMPRWGNRCLRGESPSPLLGARTLFHRSPTVGIESCCLGVRSLFVFVLHAANSHNLSQDPKVLIGVDRDRFVLGILRAKLNDLFTDGKSFDGRFAF